VEMTSFWEFDHLVVVTIINETIWRVCVPTYHLQRCHYQYLKKKSHGQGLDHFLFRLNYNAGPAFRGSSGGWRSNFEIDILNVNRDSIYDFFFFRASDPSNSQS
jgi:hypothetical protein